MHFCPLSDAWPLPGPLGDVLSACTNGVLSFLVQVLLMKSYLHHRGLKDVFTGGLGSFSLTVMLIFYLEVSRAAREEDHSKRHWSLAS